jgi:cell division septation protein DedD
LPKNEDGEFELILGNRQMMSVFFIVVLLFGVIFAIGYILGRNSGPSPEVAAAHKVEKPMVVPSPAQDTTQASAEPAQQPSPPETQKPVEPKPADPKKAEPPPEPVKKADKPAPLKPGPLNPAPASQSASGTYLQLFATSKTESEALVDVLRKKGFKAIMSQHPDKPELFRVLVGPIADGTANKTKADLQAAGFPGDKAIKKTF